MQGDADEGTPAEALRMADQLVALVKRRGHTLDFTPGSLALVDGLVDAIKASGATEQEASGMIYGVGCYVGEVMGRHAGGQWRHAADMGMSAVCPWPLVIALPDGHGYNPIGKAFKRFRNGEADSLVFFWQMSLRTAEILEKAERPAGEQ
jgi:hypothetical protein